MLEIGLIGFGRWGKLIFRDLRALDVSVHVAVPGEQSRTAAMAAGAASVCTQASELPDVDGYVVAAPTILHAQCITPLMGRGKPIFVEKPLTCDPVSASRIAEEIPDRIFVMDKWRYHPGILKLSELAGSGALGEIRAVRSYRLGWGNPHKDVDAAWILLPHDFSIAQDILGYLPELETVLVQHKDLEGQDLTVRLKDKSTGVSVTCEISALHPGNRRSVVVIGSTAVAQLADSYDDRVLFAATGDDESPREIRVDTKMPLLAELEAFIAHVKGGPPPKSSAREGAVTVQRVAEARAMAGWT
ncbi:Gfo/Idh/MocA family oxidoreductase [uncultured Roseibium sp.]|uniref:Gfo/Idh/MocA family protein n=1 Tax=uncultured Roseibium sp. TaxID=1936171 RepID=UPI0032177138